LKLLAIKNITKEFNETQARNHLVNPAFKIKLLQEHLKAMLISNTVDFEINNALEFTSHFNLKF